MGPSTPIDVVVVGGSLTGLAAGVALKSLPALVKSVTILERYPEAKLQDQGAGIRVGPEVQEFYQKYAGAAPDEYSLGMYEIKILAVDGSVIREGEVPHSFATSWGQLFRVLRQRFVGSDGDDEGGEEKGGKRVVCRYRNGCRVEKVVERGSKVDVVFLDEAGNEQTTSADLVLGADGASSIVRQIFLPETERTYAGYVILRGLVPLDRLRDETRATFDRTGIMCWNNNSQVLSYNVPGKGASIEEAGVLCNWAWYSIKEGDELADLLTDADGVKHNFSIPIGGMQEKWVERIQKTARLEVPPQLAEAIEMTERPFVQAITDSLVRDNVYCKGKVLLLGDAAAGQRPHTASAVTQCVFAATLLVQYLQGQIDMEEWSRETHSISSLLVSAGHELGLICMSTSLSPAEKMQQFMPKFLGTHGQLSAKWNERKSGSETKI